MTFTTKKIAALLLVAIMLISFSSCGQKKVQKEPEVVINLYASKYAVLAVSNLTYNFQAVSNGKYSVLVTYDEPKMLAAKIEAGYACDVFICEDAECMDWLDASKDTDANPNKNDCIVSESRADVFKGTPEGAEEEKTFSVAMVKTTQKAAVVQKFLDFLHNAESDSSYYESGFERVQ